MNSLEAFSALVGDHQPWSTSVEEAGWPSQPKLS